MFLFSVVDFSFDFIFIGDSLKSAAQPQVPPVIQNNNHQPSFKRKINLESVTAKENNPRIATRPASAQPKISTDNSKLLFLFIVPIFH